MRLLANGRQNMQGKELYQRVETLTWTSRVEILHDSLKLDHCGIVKDGSTLKLSVIQPLAKEAHMIPESYQSPYARPGKSPLEVVPP